MINYYYVHEIRRLELRPEKNVISKVWPKFPPRQLRVTSEGRLSSKDCEKLRITTLTLVVVSQDEVLPPVFCDQ